MTKRRFKPGRKIKTVARFSKLMDDGAWIYHRHKITHYGWAQGWPFRYVSECVARGILFEAVEVKP